MQELDLGGTYDAQSPEEEQKHPELVLRRRPSVAAAESCSRCFLQGQRAAPVKPVNPRNCQGPDQRKECITPGSALEKVTAQQREFAFGGKSGHRGRHEKVMGECGREMGASSRNDGSDFEVEPFTRSRAEAREQQSLRTACEEELPSQVAEVGKKLVEWGTQMSSKEGSFLCR
ncbi:hypothetical protein H920_14810 [Fukomys damarensis]|uniref:Uncharacterized protein n=1 Tax=Fukomys damarensis TaxID=885580 RepID=A0A091DLB7_FUKDA|nr:hypothetical protein H920_14810 [Fukomys damarensis]